MQPAARQVRAFFAPVDRSTSTPTPFNFGRDAMFPLASPPAAWLDAGWITNFTRIPTTKLATLRSGPKAAPAAQFRAQLGGTVDFEFRQWGKLQMALACGSEQMNVLRPDLDADPSGGHPLAPSPVLAGSSATQLLMNTADLARFTAGDLVAVDVDYVAQTGYVGTGIAAAYVQSAASVHFDVNYIRRATFNVARVASVSATALTLAQPLLGGAPAAAAQAQKIIGFTDREGGPFMQEWSALFVIPDELGGRVLFYYPRLQSSATAREASLSLGRGTASAAEVTTWSQHASFTALPVTASEDNQQIVCQRAYLPAQSAAVY